MPYRRALLATVFALAASPAWAWSRADVAQPQPPVNMSPVRDRTGAVTFNVPTGWQVQANWGGFAPYERFIVRMQAPSGSMLLQMQDARIPETYLLPGPGLAVGQVIPYGNIPVPVQPYRSGAQFAAEWVNALYGQSGACRPLQATDSVQVRTPPEAARFALGQVQGGSSGYVFFTCTRPNGQTVDGAAYATTVQSLYMGHPIWTVTRLWHFLVDPARAPQGFALASQVVDSVQVNQQALAALNARTAAASGPTGDPSGSQAMVDALNRSAINKFAAMHEQNQMMGQILTDSQPAEGPFGPTSRPYNSGGQGCQPVYGGAAFNTAGSCPPGTVPLR